MFSIFLLRVRGHRHSIFVIFSGLWPLRGGGARLFQCGTSSSLESVITCALTLISITFSKINIFQFCKKYVIANKILNKISSNNIFGEILFVPKSGGKVVKCEKISRSRSVKTKKKGSEIDLCGDYYISLES